MVIGLRLDDGPERERQLESLVTVLQNIAASKLAKEEKPKITALRRVSRALGNVSSALQKPIGDFIDLLRYLAFYSDSFYKKD